MAEYRSKTRAKANEVGLSVEQMIYLALYHLQIDKEDAWDFATQGKDINVAKKYRKEQMAEAESKGKAFLNMLDDRETDSFDPSDKNSIIRRIEAEVRKSEPNSTVISGLKLMIDAQNMKKEESNKDDSTIHYYLPITCQMCELYEKAKRE